MTAVGCESIGGAVYSNARGVGNSSLIVGQLPSPRVHLPAHKHHRCQHPRLDYRAARRVETHQARLERLEGVILAFRDGPFGAQRHQRRPVGRRAVQDLHGHRSNVSITRRGAAGAARAGPRPRIHPNVQVCSDGADATRLSPKCRTAPRCHRRRHSTNCPCRRSGLGLGGDGGQGSKARSLGRLHPHSGGRRRQPTWLGIHS